MKKINSTTAPTWYKISRMWSQLIVLLLISPTFVPQASYSQESRVEIDSYMKNDDDQNIEDTIIDHTRNSVSRSILSFSQNIDSFFGDDRIILEENKSHLVIADTLTISEGKKRTFSPKIRLRIRLPRTQKKLNLIVDNVVDQLRKSDVDNNLADGSSGQFDDQGVTAALRYTALSDRKWDINTNAGIKLKIPLDPFASFRIRRSVFLKDWEMRMSEDVFWFNSSGLGQIGRMDFDYNIRDTILFRVAHTQSWQEGDNFFRFTHGFFAFQKLTDSKALSYSAFVTALSDPTQHINNYTLAISYRQQLWRKWLFFSVTPSVNYPLSNRFSSVYAISLSIESIFKEIPKLSSDKTTSVKKRMPAHFPKFSHNRY